MLSKRYLMYLEGMLLLLFLFKTNSKRETASLTGISVDTLNKYISNLENTLRCKLILSSRNPLQLTAKGDRVVNKIADYYERNYVSEKNFNLLNIKHLRSLFYLKAVAIFGNKNNTSQNLASSLETINLYINSIESELDKKLITCDNMGSYLTKSGNELIKKFDKLIETAEYIKNVSQKYHEYCNVRFGIDCDIDILKLINGNRRFNQSIMVFDDDPNLHINDWHMALTYTKPINNDLIILKSKNVPCAFFVSQDYIDEIGRPTDINEIKEKHFVIDGSTQNFASRKYRNFIQKCKNVHPMLNDNIILSESTRYGSGIGIMPLTVCRHNLVLLDEIKPIADTKMYLLAHRNIVKDVKYKTLLDWCTEIFNKL